MPKAHPPTKLVVNGSPTALDVDPRTPLLLVLRNDLGLKGTRAGCGIGECGACTVLVDGEPMTSCSMGLEVVAGREVTTPEGLGTPSAPHHVQQTFLDEQAGQCGYCINGMIMTVTSFCDSESGGHDDLIAKLAEHICRCGTYTRILRAARQALAPDSDEESRNSDAQRPWEVLSHTNPTDEWRQPDIVERYPDVESWIRLSESGRVEVLTGKVELGQGIRTALGQIVAAQIGLSPENIDVVAADTAQSPDEGYTSGSHSIDRGGAAVATAAVALRRLLLERATQVAAADAPSPFEVGDDAVMDANGTPIADLRSLAAKGPFTGPILTSDKPDWTRSPLGEPWHRPDLLPKLTGSAAYVQDMSLPGMIHARVVLPPTYDATVDQVDTTECEAMPGVVRVIRDGRLLIVLAEREEQAANASARLKQDTQWKTEKLDIDGSLPESFRTLPSKRYTVVEGNSEAPENDGGLTATYRQPYQAHAAVAPSCAVAVHDKALTRVWTHSQGIHPLRRELATLLDEDLDQIEVSHRDGPGCYGHNLADDAAVFAALAARTVPGTPVRFQFTVEDEFTWEPYGSAMLADLDATVADGRVTEWKHHTLTDVHGTRPSGSGENLMAARLRDGGRAPNWPGPHEGGARNVAPPYDFPSVDGYADYVQGPMRTSSLRSLGAFLNVFAAESFVDELAEVAGEDPVAFRLAHASDPRLARVVETVADRIGWQHRVGPSGRGLGIAVARYKNEKAYVAQAVEATVDTSTTEIEVVRIVTVCDAGTVVNPDGLVNQLEGGTLQALSRTLLEQVLVDGKGVQSRDWASYPVLRIDQTPSIETVLIEDRNAPPLGAGEASMPPAAAALANAVDDAVGIRLRDIPFTRESIERRLFEMTETEDRRVLLK